MGQGVRDEIERQCAKLLIRHIAGALSSSSILLGDDRIGDDRDALLLLWALSTGVGDALQLLVRESRHLVRSRENVVQETSGSGALLALKTSLLQIRTSNPSRFVAKKSKVTRAGGANQCLAWFVESVDRALIRFPQIFLGPWRDAARQRVGEVQKARAIPGLSECFAQGLHKAPLPLSSLRQAASLRSPLYSQVLAQIRLRDWALRSSVTDAGALAASALASVEVWRQMELLGALKAVNALEEQSHRAGLPFSRSFTSLIGNGNELARCGPLYLRWQFPTPALASERRAPHEALSDSIIESLGIRSSADRADIAVHRDGVEGPVAIGEVKYFESDSNALNQLALAIWQLSKYADQVTGTDAGAQALLKKCFVFIPAHSRLSVANTLSASTDSCPVIVDFKGTAEDERWKRWASLVIDSTR